MITTNFRKTLFAHFAACSAVLTVIVTAATGTLAAASGSCGEFSFGFEGTRLLNDGISESAGPFPILLPAGTYDLIMVSSDDHTSRQFHGEQPAEQWYVELDSGWSSPLSDDLPDDRDSIVTTHAQQQIPASTAITVRHLGEGTVNSINVVCAGFTSVDLPVQEALVPAEDIPEEAVVEAGTMESDLSEAAPEVVDQQISEPATVIAEPEIEETELAEPEVLGVVESLADQQTVEPTAVPAEPFAAAQIAPETSAARPAEGQDVTVAKQLALTGPSDLIVRLSISGVLMMLLGTFLVRRQSSASNA